MKQKWKSAEQKRKTLELQQDWNTLKDRYDSLSTSKQTVRKTNDFTTSFGFRVPAGRSTSTNIPSLETRPGVGAKVEPQLYTGGLVKGISIVHKSCLQPVFSDEQAKDFANMRR